MRLYDEIFKNADGGALQKCILVPNGGGYFEGVKAVGEFSESRIVVSFPKTDVEIVGAGLSIAKYYEGDLQVSGRITAVKILGEEGEV